MSGNVADTFDYVIVGSGAAGAILAHRLSADGAATVRVLEAGPPDKGRYLHIPAGFIKVLFNPKYTWQFTSEPTAETKGRRIPIPQGRTLGGSTSVNGLVYNRGQPEDYDGWAERGNRGWSYADVLPYFKRTERKLGACNPAFHGAAGLLPVTDNDWFHPICEQFIEGAVGLGMPRNPDYNGASQAGVGYFQRTIHRGWRRSTADTFLRDTAQRQNLSVVTNAEATAVVFEDRRAVGVRYLRGGRNGSSELVRARREVLLCAGAINTPKLLQLSGVGPGPLLADLGVPVVRQLSGVGTNLRDHISVRVVARVKGMTINQLARGPHLWMQVARWSFGRPSILALSPSIVHWFWYSRPGLERPDLQGVFSPASYRAGYVGMLDTFPGMTAGVWQHRPNSAGYVRARSRDPAEAPIVQPNYLEDARDREALLGGIRMARHLLQTPPLAKVFEAEVLPGPAVESDDELLDFARQYGVSSYHVNGTARMGPASDPDAVVGPDLRVHGIDALRVADASIMPVIPSANTCAATMMIAEKAYDLIRGQQNLGPQD